jgi:hypothetical protein|tara:strand:+ start:492 stop:1064 length:573 start_codon:yes stop_codon:yes gene_type:complete
MSSEAEICSNALSLLGDDPITALTDDSTRARLCNRFYASTRDSVLRAFTWNFAITRQALAQSTTTPNFEFSFQYQLPEDPFCLKALKIDDDYEKWRVEGRFLLTNASTVSLQYIARITDVGQYDALFTESLEYRLAEKMAWPITQNNKSVEVFNALYTQKLAEARTMSSQEGYGETFDADDLIVARAEVL